MPIQPYTYVAALRLLYKSVCLLLLCASTLAAQQLYEAKIDLRKVKEDRLQVLINTPAVAEETAEFYMPKIVPGTYSISDFGRFVNDLQALDKRGKSLPVKQLDENRWQIQQAKRLAQLSYWVDDTFDAPEQGNIFPPGGSNIEANENFVINTFSFFGYLKGYKNLPYRLQVRHSKDMYGTTALPIIQQKKDMDLYEAANYFDLADGPLLYAAADTAWISIGGARVLIGVYASKGGLSSSLIRDEIKQVLQAQVAYLGGEMPVDKYAFLVYAEQLRGTSYGALEHAYSSLYYLPEPPNKTVAQQLAGTIRSIAAHEFFHIITPLTIHAEEIGNFDFIEPKMSKHLWMYEGVTEYFAQHAQLVGKILDGDAFAADMAEKIQNMLSAYKDDLPFTEMSKNVLTTYKDQYGNVYEKGAIIGLCLDILLREYSEGTKGLMPLMQALSKEYGKTKSFKDEELFDKIASLTDPRVRDFFSKYVEGPAPLPLAELLPKVGLSYRAAQPEQVLLADNVPLRQGNVEIFEVDPSLGKVLVVIKTRSEEGAFEERASAIIKLGDLAMNNYADTKEALLAIRSSFKAGDEVPYTGISVGKQGPEMKEGTITFSEDEMMSSVKVNWVADEALTEKQRTMRKSWLSIDLD